MLFRSPPGGIVGVIGPNGAGKTTLFRMITGQEKPDKGSIDVGESVQLGYVDQSRDALHAEKTVWEEVSEGNEVIYLGKREINSRAYCSAFNFKGADQQKKVGQLSGGERNRVHLAKMLKSGANVLLLDEPTNDLDLETLDLLEEMLADYKGTLILVSHDRDFLDRIATSTLMSEGSGRWIEYAGGYSDMVSQRGEGVTARSNFTLAQKKQTNKNIITTPPSVEGASIKNKLTFNEQHALQELPKKMEELSKKKIKLQSILDDSDLYKRDPERFNLATQSLVEVDCELSAAEEKWLELEIKRESLVK